MQQEGDVWLKWRKIGSSDCPVIMGVSPYKTPYQLYQEKLGLVEPEKPSYAMEEGKKKEIEVRDSFSKWINLDFRPTCIESETLPWMTASLDGFVTYGENMSVNEANIAHFIEIKMNNKENHEMALNRIIPESHKMQMLHQYIAILTSKQYKGLGVRGEYISWHNGDRKIVSLQVDSDLLCRIMEAEEKFWNNLQERTPPPMTERDYHDASEDGFLKFLLNSYHTLCAEEKAILAKKDDIRKLIIDRAEGRNLRVGDHQVTKTLRKGSVDYSAIPELSGVDLDKYRKAEIETWRIS